jgi:uncharacterized protein (TIGR02145 family)
MIGKQIEKYTIISHLGEGGMASVYMANDNKFDTNVAIKVLNKEYVHNENIRKRFLAEAKNMFKMSHPNIIKVNDLIDDGDTVAFVMEHIEGETLKEYLERKGKLSDDEIKTIFSQMLEAVGYVHEQNLVHRDIKPSNFMITPKGQIKLLDFGIAKNTDTQSADYTQTGTSQNMGTPMYMSPEQIKSTKDVTLQSDIYSLGVVLWQMVMGKKPYDSSTLSTWELQTKIVQDALVVTATQWDKIISCATEKQEQKRYQSCQQLMNVIGNNSGGQSEIKIGQKKVVLNTEQTIIDNREYINNVVYPEVIIGQQIWMSKNLDISHFRNGDSIPEAKTNEEWKKAGSNGEPAWCYYNNEPSNGVIYGKLYNWYAVNDSRGLAPEGWHAPSNSEWSILIDFLGGDKIAGLKLKSSSGWAANGNGNNTIGFKGLPGGYRFTDCKFSYIGCYGYFWSANYYNSQNAWFNLLLFNLKVLDRGNYSKSVGFSVRCIKN